ncbi:DUF4236 domain-containing protein [Anoxynatronum buryatiense]|uniref:Tetratricopeptide repeat-containing protein n=1 Tax=Anoxynatronum buryatiense TaxID=489973 RepID=A0AA45WXF5_9CLOT|nr:DUF4236 domain-containing protein [Anoxynatronum buryatiense]SMP64200.1 Tetratricopeptide repeat-containing protein [Anoxynatronum buryatiense]
MGIRFRRSISLGKGARLNLSKGGLGISVGGKGARVGLGPRGAYTSAGIPGTGLYAINYAGKSKQRKNTPVNKRTEAPVMNAQLPAPPEIKTSLPTILLIASILLLPVGGLGAIGLVIYALLWFKSPKWKANRHYREGKKYYLKAQHKEALDELVKVQELMPETYSIYPLMADSAYHLAKHDKVIHYYEAYLERDPNDYMVRFNYGLALSEIGKYEEAVRELQQMPEEMAKELPLLIALGNALLESGKPEQAVAVLETGPTRKQNMDGLMKMFRYILGCAYQGSGDVKKAVKQFQKVAAFDINYEDVSTRLAELEA